jgi:hypothetical protein
MRSPWLREHKEAFWEGEEETARRLAEWIRWKREWRGWETGEE